MARGPLGMEEILETVAMVGNAHLDIRTVTLGVDLRGCRTPEAVKARVTAAGGALVETAEGVARETGIPIVNRRVAVTPIAWVAERPDRILILELAQALDEAADTIGVDFIGGLSALVEKHSSRIDEELMAALPQALADTKRVCASVNIATTSAGINMDAVRMMGEVVKATAERTADRSAIGCAKLVVFANAVPDNPFMAGAFHGFGEGDQAISVGISGPGVVADAIRRLPPGTPLQDLSEEIKRTVFKITRVGEHVGREVARRMGVNFGIVDISLAPTSTPGDSVAEILELIGVERVGLPGTTVALAMLNDAVKKGGAMATSRAGGLSGAFIPVSEDANMASAAADGHLVAREARGDDGGLLGRARHDRAAGRHVGPDDRGDHRRRGGHRDDQPQDDRVPPGARARSEARRLGGLGRPARQGTRDERPEQGDRAARGPGGSRSASTAGARQLELQLGLVHYRNGSGTRLGLERSSPNRQYSSHGPAQSTRWWQPPGPWILAPGAHVCWATAVKLPVEPTSLAGTA